jgi:hypothetical protein
MLKCPLLVGANGSMGKRYGAILKYLAVDYLAMDVDDDLPDRGSFDGVILATPTDLHAEQCLDFGLLGVPILVEKPLATDVETALKVAAALDGQVPLRMVNQYRYLADASLPGRTWYDYFRHGSDGLAWDCISILGLASGEVTLGETSPFWDCTINGQALSLDRMDEAYVAMLASWIDGEHEGASYIKHAHLKVAQYIESRR